MKQTILILCLLVTIGSCKKKDECKGGSGGNLTITLYPQHHGMSIFSTSDHLDTAYIKFNTHDAPAQGVAYDLIEVGEEGENHIHVKNMKCGDYYVYMTGFDTTIGERVKGSTPVTTSQKDGNLNVNVPVSE